MVTGAISAGGAAAQPAAILYRDPRWEGDPLAIDDDVPQLSARGFNDSTSSIRLGGLGPVAVYKDAGYGGAFFTVRADVRSMSGAGFGNDNISSIRVSWTCEGDVIEVNACASHPCEHDEVCTDLPRPAPDTDAGRSCRALAEPPPERPVALLYPDSRSRGTPLPVMADIPRLSELGFNDTASSIELLSADPIAVYQDAWYGGKCLTVSARIKSLSDAGFGNDSLSSVRVGATCNGLIEHDACAANPCPAGLVCRDLPRPAPASADGRPRSSSTTWRRR